MTTRMVHPLHGATHAYDAGEIERLKGHGWLTEGLSVGPVVVGKLTDAPVNGGEFVVTEVTETTMTITPVVARKKPGPKPKAK